MIVFCRLRRGKRMAFFFGSNGYLYFDNDFECRAVMHHWQKWMRS